MSEKYVPFVNLKKKFKNKKQNKAKKAVNSKPHMVFNEICLIEKHCDRRQH